ncbi:putative acyl-activating enzyme 17, peroxisomal [Morella rubra]|uniref:Putative acyl-activating enzyme 17, peroxisomal n=1 Tax=Morella rubra TaxID=262757 RepID=A0A6A1W1A0_9ROSI|nr:putative acyl-activating enzyme 17, peroxisomal [Morella rubra]
MACYKGLDHITRSDIEALGIAPGLAERLHERLTEIIIDHGPGTPDTWLSVSKRLLSPDLPFSFHQMMYYGCYRDYGPDPPAWIPDPDVMDIASEKQMLWMYSSLCSISGFRIARKIATLTNVGQLLERRGKEFLGSKYRDPISSFSDVQEFSVLNPEVVYWKAVLDEMSISFSVPPQCILRESPHVESHSPYPSGHWLPGAIFNTAKNCLSLNRKRSLDDVVVIWRDEGDENLPVCRMTLRELRADVWLAAHAISTLGLEEGSAIAIDMPMTVNSVIIYLAIILAGYVVVSIADSFAPHEISTRLKISKARAIFTQDLIIRGGKRIPLYRSSSDYPCHMVNYELVLFYSYDNLPHSVFFKSCSRIVEAQSPMAIVIPVRGSSFSMKLRDDDISWDDFLGRVKDLKEYEFAAVEQPVEAFINILFSSGTTGDPKAIPWTHATPLKAAADAWRDMDIHKGDIVAWPTNLGWMMGPWLIYASLLNGASMALYNGSPLSFGFAKFVQFLLAIEIVKSPGVKFVLHTCLNNVFGQQDMPMFGGGEFPTSKQVAVGVNGKSALCKCGVEEIGGLSSPGCAEQICQKDKDKYPTEWLLPWTHATPLKAAADAWRDMDIHKGDIVAWPTNLGWMMGPWLIYASLLNGASMALYNGSPLSFGFAKFVQKRWLEEAQCCQSSSVCSQPKCLMHLFPGVGDPKAIPWTHATPLKAAADAWRDMDIHKGDIVAWPTNLGWMSICFIVKWGFNGSFLLAIEIVKSPGVKFVLHTCLNNVFGQQDMPMFGGGEFPTSKQVAVGVNGKSALCKCGVEEIGVKYSQSIQDAKVTMLGVIPSIVRAWKSTNCTAGYDWSAIRCFSSSGESSNVDEYLWLMGRAHYKPIIECCGGTEIGGAFITGSLLQAQSLAAFSTPAPGCSLFILGNDGYPIPQNAPGIGEMALGSLMFGASNTLLNADHHDVYFKGMAFWKGRVLRRHGDFFERSTRGYYHAHGRADDTMNLGGIKVSSVEIERVCNAVDNNVLETAAIGVPPPGGGPEELVIVVVFKDSDSMKTELNQLKISFNSAVQTKLNPLFRVSQVVHVSSLPRTASNKVMRRVLRQQLAQLNQSSRL